jgi:hypothetical protein
MQIVGSYLTKRIGKKPAIRACRQALVSPFRVKDFLKSLTAKHYRQLKNDINPGW